MTPQVDPNAIPQAVGAMILLFFMCLVGALILTISFNSKIKK